MRGPSDDGTGHRRVGDQGRPFGAGGQGAGIGRREISGTGEGCQGKLPGVESAERVDHAGGVTGVAPSGVTQSQAAAVDPVAAFFCRGESLDTGPVPQKNMEPFAVQPDGWVIPS